MSEEAYVTPEQTVGAALERQAHGFPDKEALVFGGKRATFGEWNDRANRLSLGLERMGIGKGDCVGVVLPSAVELPYLMLGLAKLGAIGVLVNPLLTPTEVEFQLRDTEAKAIVLVSPFANRDLLAAVQEMCPRLPTLGPIIVMGPKQPGVMSFDEMLEGEAPPPRDTYVREGVTCDDPFALLWSGGTTGLPKAVPVTSYNFLYVHARNDNKYSHNDIYLQVPPLYLTFGFVSVAVPLLFGAKLVGLQGFDPRTILQTMQDEKVTLTGGYPTMLRWIMSLPTFSQYDLSSMRLIFAGGEPITEQLVRQMRQSFGCDVSVGYGMTEMRGITSTVLTDPPELIANTDGRAIGDIELRLVDAEGQDVPFGEVGEIAVRGRAVFTGYWKRPELNTQVFDQDGFFHTGDLARYVNPEGYIRFVGRAKDTIRRSLMNVYPEEIENHLKTNPKIAAAGVIGIPSPITGERIRAYVQLRPNMEMSAVEVMDHCRAALSAYKLPDEVRFVDSLPLSATQRVRRWLLREEAKRELEQASG